MMYVLGSDRQACSVCIDFVHAYCFVANKCVAFVAFCAWVCVVCDLQHTAELGDHWSLSEGTGAVS